MIECFGAALRGYRKIFKITQEELGDIMLCSRITVNSIEKVKYVSELTNANLFRLYYFLSKANNDEFNLIGCLRQDVDLEIGKRIDSYDENENGGKTK